MEDTGIVYVHLEDCLKVYYTFIGAKYSFETLAYQLMSATMEFPNRRVLGFTSLIIEQWLRRYSIQLDR